MTQRLFSKRIFNQRGVTLTELLIAASLLSVVFVATTSVYISGLKMAKEASYRDAVTDGYLLLEHISRRCSLGLKPTITHSGAGLKLQWDRLNYETARDTPDNLTDDTFIKYRFIGGNIRTRLDTTITADVTSTAEEVIQGLNITSCLFSTSVDQRSVKIEFTMVYGENNSKTKDYQTTVYLLSGPPGF